jgi:hypothetical protein
MSSLAAAALGIFLYVQPDAPALAQAATLAYITDPGVSGFTLEVKWSDIEPSPGVFDWSTIDFYALPVAAAGKPIKIGIVAGGATPSWLYTSPYNVPNATILSSGPKPVFICQSADEPAFWNANFQTAWTAAQQALAAHMAAIGASVAVVELTGLNHTTTELNLGTQAKPPPGSSCPFTDATTQWLSIGYRPGLAVTAANQLYGDVTSAWPGVPATLSYIANNAMPRISAAGKSESVAAAELVFDQIVGAAIAEGSGVQWNSLSANDGVAIPAIWMQEVDAGAFGVLQTPAYASGGKGNPCAPPDHPAPCSDALFGQSLQLGIAAGARIIEVWAGDFIYEDQIFLANQALQQEAPGQQRHPH